MLNKLSIKTKIIIITQSILVISAVIGITLNIIRLRMVYIDEIYDYSSVVAIEIQNTVNKNLEYFPLDSLTGMSVYLQKIISNKKNISYSYIANNDGVILYHCTEIKDHSNLNHGISRSFVFTDLHKPVNLESGNYYDTILPLVSNNLVIGTVHIGVDKKLVNDEITPVILQSILSFVTLMIISGIILQILLAKIIIKPLKNLVKTMKKVATEDDFNEKVTITSKDEIGELSSTFNIMTDKLVNDLHEMQKLDRMKDEFFAIASHELRTPLTAIRGNAALIKQYYGEKLEDKDLKQMIDDIHISSIRLINVVNDFLSISRLEQGKIIYKNESFDITELSINAVKEVELSAREKKISINVKMPDIPLKKAFADKLRVREIIINILGNAIKYTETGTISISFKNLDNKVEVSIEDTGIGISAKNSELLFGKFQQAGDNILTRDTTKSTGLGLYTAKLLIEQMNGQIYLKHSEENKGSTFAFTLPFA